MQKENWNIKKGKKMSIFAIKILACITMILDHIKYAIPITNNFITKYFGRIAFPLFAFLITEGYIHTKNLKQYYKRLILFAIISQVPFMLFRSLVSEQYLMLNVMFTLLLGLIAITIYDKIKNKFFSMPLCFVFICLGEILKVDYGWFGVAAVFLFYIFKEKEIFKIVGFSALTAIYFAWRGLFDFISIEILLLYIFRRNFYEKSHFIHFIGDSNDCLLAADIISVNGCKFGFIVI